MKLDIKSMLQDYRTGADGSGSIYEANLVHAFKRPVTLNSIYVKTDPVLVVTGTLVVCLIDVGGTVTSATIAAAMKRLVVPLQLNAAGDTFVYEPPLEYLEEWECNGRRMQVARRREFQHGVLVAAFDDNGLIATNPALNVSATAVLTATKL
jgi:hypothetical protein